MKRPVIAAILVVSFLFCQFPYKPSLAQQSPDDIPEVYAAIDHQQPDLNKRNSPAHSWARRHWAGLVSLGLIGLNMVPVFKYYWPMNYGYAGLKAGQETMGTIMAQDLEKLIQVLTKMRKIGMLSQDGKQFLKDLVQIQWRDVDSKVATYNIYYDREVSLTGLKIPKSDWKIVNKLVVLGPWATIIVFVVLDIIFNPSTANAYDGVMPLSIIDKYSPFPCRQVENTLHMAYASLGRESKKHLSAIYNDKYFDANSIFDIGTLGEDLFMERIYYPSYYLIKASINQILESDHGMDRTDEKKSLEKEFLDNQELYAYYKIMGQEVCSVLLAADELSLNQF